MNTSISCPSTSQAHEPTRSDLVIRTFLDLSTAHLRQETCDKLNSYEGVLAYRTTHGWLMYVPGDDDGLADKGEWPSELLPIVELARAEGCAYILFDADAAETALLPTFDW